MNENEILKSLVRKGAVAEIFSPSATGAGSPLKQPAGKLGKNVADDPDA